MRGVPDKIKIRCFNHSSYGHIVIECQKPKRDRDTKEVVNIAQIPDDEPTLLLVEKEEKKETMMLINEVTTPKLNNEGVLNKLESNLWYLDN